MASETSEPDHDLEGSYSPQMTDLPPEMRPKKIDWSKLKPVGIAAGVLLVLWAGYTLWPRSPLSSFKSEVRKVVRDYKAGTETAEEVAVLDFDVTKSDSLARPYDAYVTIEVRAPLSLRHPELPTENDRTLMCTAIAEQRLAYSMVDGDWELTSIGARTRTVVPRIDEAEVPELPHSVRTLLFERNGEFYPVELDLYGVCCGPDLSDLFFLTKDEFEEQFPVD